jgi:hypothetical protein
MVSLPAANHQAHKSGSGRRARKPKRPKEEVMPLTIDSRLVQVEGFSRVDWDWLDGNEGLANPMHAVHLFDEHGDCVVAQSFTSAQSARDAFQHPFARLQGVSD